MRMIRNMLDRNIDFFRRAAARPLLRSFVLETCSEVDVRGVRQRFKGRNIFEDQKWPKCYKNLVIKFLRILNTF